MRSLPAVAMLVLFSCACGSAGRGTAKPMPALSYPTAIKGDVVDDYHGTTVSDPYRWMEDLDSKETAAWVAASNAVTEPYLAQLPHRQKLRSRLTELWNYPRVSLPQIEGGRLFYTKNTGLQRQAPLYVRDSLTAEPMLVLDPNAISADGSLSVAQYEPSPDGRLLAYGLSAGGADWQTLKVRDVATGVDGPDTVEWMRFSEIAWTKDSKGFFYARYPEPPKGKVLEAALSGHALYYHAVGTPQSADRLIFQRKDLATWVVNGLVSEDGRYLFVVMWRGSGNQNRLYVADLGDPMIPRITAPIAPVVEADDAEYFPIGNNGPIVYLRSDKGAPNRTVTAIDLRNPSPSAWKTVVPERTEPLENLAIIGGTIVAHYLVDVQSRLAMFGLDGAPRGDVTLPGVGSVVGLAGRHDRPELWYSFTDPLTPTTAYVYDPVEKRSTPFEAPTLPVDVTQFETKALFATSRDGTRVPFFLTAKKDLPRDGDNPTMLYAYGGFSVTTLPTYRADVPAWLEMGGVWVTASIRGGAEYGESWHEAGMLERKQNVFDDFIAVAEHLVRETYTSSSKLGIMGGSNGGLLVGAVMEQRPDLFAVALPQVGVMDMLRYDRFTGGRLWVPEYGSSSDPRQFPFLIKYSPLHNVKAGTCYPATLVTTADHDDRVVPSHSFKFAATLQAAQGCDRPVLIRVEVQGSHGYRPTDKLIAERADLWAFAAANMNIRNHTD